MQRSDLVKRARGVVNVNALVIAALGLGVVSNMLIAALFGLSHRVDAYFAALVLPTLFMALCIDYLGKNFLPVLASAKAVGEACASSVTSSIVTIVALLAAALTGLLLLFSPLLFAALLPGFDAEAARAAFAAPDGHVGAVSPEGAVDTLGEAFCARGSRSGVVGLTPFAGGFAVTCDGGTVALVTGKTSEPPKAAPSSSADPSRLRPGARDLPGGT